MEQVEVFAGNILEVGLVQSLLEKEGIQSWLRDEIMGTLNSWYVSPGGSGAIKVLVLKFDYGKALDIIKEYEKSQQVE